ncbi:type II toxin-antitoxin system HicA family toxin [Pediococcus ethanolidurans]
MYCERGRSTLPIKTKQFERILRKNGFKPIRQAGSHRIYHNSTTNN